MQEFFSFLHTMSRRLMIVRVFIAYIRALMDSVLSPSAIPLTQLAAGFQHASAMKPGGLSSAAGLEVAVEPSPWSNEPRTLNS
jgi:hypothetical protein